jgi:hypothetical protein
MPPPVLAVNREGDLAELSYFLPHGWGLDKLGVEDAAKVILGAAVEVPVFGPTAGFALLPATAVEETRQRLKEVITTRAERMTPSPEARCTAS